MCGDGACGNVEDGTGELARDLIHVRDHQEKTLGGSKCCRQRACLKGAMDGACRPTLGLHLNHERGGAPEVLFTLGRPFIGKFAHARGGGNRINCYDLAQTMRDRSCGFISIDHNYVLFH